VCAHAHAHVCGCTVVCVRARGCVGVDGKSLLGGWVGVFVGGSVDMGVIYDLRVYVFACKRQRI
jgi:hypothetical protein